MKVSIGANIKEGPWGGGNLFVINLRNYLEKKGHEVIFDLNSNDIDLILLTDPRRKSESSAFTHKQIKKYKRNNNHVKVVHRINECDERKDTKGVNKFYINANKVADHTIFVSEWLSDIYKKSGFLSESSIIYSGSDLKVFNRDGFNNFNGIQKVKLVTHHWSSNWNKGFDTYKRIDELINDEYWSNKIEFTYIGNVPKNLELKNTNIIEPLSGIPLAAELKKHNIYVTGSLNEPSGNHHIEAAQCGLPLLYINSGALPEYCSGFGVEFNLKNFEDKLKYLIDNYSTFFQELTKYPFNAEKMCEEYLDIFMELHQNKK